MIRGIFKFWLVCLQIPVSIGSVHLRLLKMPSVFCWTCWTVCLFEPRHDKTNKLSGRPAKSQISLGILGGCPGWSESSLGARSLCWFCHAAAYFLCVPYSQFFFLLFCFLFSFFFFFFFGTIRLLSLSNILILHPICLYAANCYGYTLSPADAFMYLLYLNITTHTNLADWPIILFNV